ncbi:PorT family protein [Gramella sp. GC03-9]|uniref:PorT family protein n=1 Tax=Christiangramia oceanisediminis TaxID=2920386 RepID=A0A9X2KUL5_9FLAO|nr:porin family protein [Gramella oceanisediminis]MCP9198282.1 PorT family protein [Gramella oceanisediminis]
MKKLLLLALLLSGVGTYAQSAEFGLKGGLNFGATGDYETFDDVTGDFKESMSGDSKTGFHAGVFAQFKVLGIFLQPELMYTELTTDYSEFEYKLSKIDAPVLLGINILGPLNIKAGPSFQYILKNEVEKSDISIGEVENDITAGYQLGAGLDLGRLAFDLRYEGSFSDNSASGIDQMANETFTIDSRPSQWILSLSYSL